MKILLVSTQDYIHHKIPSRHHYIFEELAKRHDVHVAHFHVSRGVQRETRLTVEEATLFPLKKPLLHYSLNAPYHFLVFNRMLRDGRYDIVVAAHVLAGTAAIHAARKHNVPVLFDLKDWFPDSAAAYFKNSLLQKVVRDSVWGITRRNLAKSSRITTVSPSLVAKLASFGFSADLITNGVDTDLFRPSDGAPARKELGIAADEFVIGFSGSVERWYALDEMIRAMPDLLQISRKIRLLIVGDSLFTDYLRELKNIVSDLRLQERVIFTGTKPYHELPRYIACMDACTIPLSPPQWGDIALPNKYFEYSACGKPIVMRPIPDVERLGRPNIFVYRTRPEYVSHIRMLMENPQKFDLDMTGFGWKDKARQFEDQFKILV